MAYALDPAAQPDEEEKKSQFADLLAPAAGAPGGDVGGVATPAAPKAASTPGFVNFDRYLNANRETANRMVDGVAGGIERKATNVETGLKSNEALGQAAASSTVAPPPATTAAGLQAQYTQPAGKPLPTITMPGNQTTGMKGQTVVAPPNLAPRPTAPPPKAPSLAEVQAKAGQTYAGPTVDQVNSKYDALLGDLTSGRDAANVAGTKEGFQALLPNATGFDADLAMGVGGGRLGALKSRFAPLSGQFDTSRAATTTAVNDAVVNSNENKSKWGALSESMAAADSDQKYRSAQNEQKVRDSYATRTAPAVAQITAEFPMFAEAAKTFTTAEMDRLNNTPPHMLRDVFIDMAASHALKRGN